MLQASPDKPLTGGCQCGRIRYEITAPPTELCVCHCLECRKQSASAFGISLFVPRAGVRVTRGTFKTWTRATDSGRSLACAFCPDCGSRLWHERVGEKEQSPIVSIKAGSLDQPVDLAEAAHYWTKRKLKGVAIPAGAKQFKAEE